MTPASLRMTQQGCQKKTALPCEQRQRPDSRHDELVAAGHLYAELYDLQARSYQT
jgi:hypothetical protein